VIVSIVIAMIAVYIDAFLLRLSRKSARLTVLSPSGRRGHFTGAVEMAERLSPPGYW
jgi:hypothetical protein